MRDELDVIDLDALVKPVGRVKLFGETHYVLPANGRSFDMLQQLTASAKGGNPAALVGMMGVAREIVKDAVPSLTADNVVRLNMDQLQAVIGISTQAIDLVQKLIADTEKNGSAPVVEVEKVTAGAKPSTGHRSKIR